MGRPAARAMSMASAAPFSGLNLPANTAPSPAAFDHGMSLVGTYGGKIASTGIIRRQALAWKADTAATPGGPRDRTPSASAAATAASGGRGIVCANGGGSPVAS